jgi:hypothetical protein
MCLSLVKYNEKQNIQHPQNSSNLKNAEKKAKIDNSF